MYHKASISGFMNETLLPQRVAEQAYQALEQLVVTLQLPPGSVTTEGVLIERLDLGRTPVREAIQRLAWEGLMEVRPRAGIAIATLNTTDWLKVIEARQSLEITLARAAARFVTPETASRFHEAALNMQRSVVSNDVLAYLAADKELDAAIASAADNPFASRVVAPLQTHSRRFWFRYQAERNLAYAAEQHVRIISAILNGDEKAAAKETDALMRMLKKQAEAAFRHTG